MQVSIFLELSKEILERGKYLCFPARGYSMYPVIRDGEVIWVKPAKAREIKLGEIILYPTPQGKLVVHRLIKRYTHNHKRVWLTKGDSMPGSEQVVYPEDVMGKVVAVEREGKKIRLDKNTFRLIGLFRTQPLVKRLKQRILNPFR